VGKWNVLCNGAKARPHKFRGRHQTLAHKEGSSKKRVFKKKGSYPNMKADPVSSKLGMTQNCKEIPKGAIRGGVSLTHQSVHNPETGVTRSVRASRKRQCLGPQNEPCAPVIRKAGECMEVGGKGYNLTVARW